jgi:8-oxo-dGTP diphosphatase
MADFKRSVAGISIDQGMFFIAQRKPGGALGEKWEFPGGKVEPGETDQEALVREYQEELGVSITIGPFLGAASFEHRGVNRVYAYQVYFSAYHITLSEHTAWRWARLDEIEHLDFADSDRKLLPYLKAYLH